MGACGLLGVKSGRNGMIFTNISETMSVRMGISTSILLTLVGGPIKSRYPVEKEGAIFLSQSTFWKKQFLGIFVS